ncbi:MAG: YaeQ family protein [Polyangia bacterium]
MALPSARFEFRLTLSDADRGVSVQQSATVASHPSETAEHLILRVLAFCLPFGECLEFGPGVSDPEAADFVARDLTGRITTWIECGAADADKVRKVAPA